ncbi:MAG: hypothetical protein KA239_08880 [Bacteroidia bacterium]|nr:hypothetical protein [Bacteroidia bacterium]
MKRLLVLLWIGINFNQAIWTQDTILPIDEAYFESNIRNSAWVADKDKVEGSLIIFQFRGDSLSFLFVNPAFFGTIGSTCTYSYFIKSNYLSFRLGGCDEETQKGPFICYFANENTMMLPLVEGPIPKDISKIPPENWLRFTRHEE